MLPPNFNLEKHMSKKTTNNQEDECTESEESKLKRFYKSLKECKFFNFRLKRNIVSIASAIIAFFAAWFSYEQVSVTREAMNITNKAYITIIKIEQDTPTASDMSEFHSILQFVNTGQTPAYNVNISLEIKIASDEFNLTPIDKIKSFKKAQVFGKNNTIPFYPEFDKINKIDSENILAQKSFIFIYGKVTYEDIFKEHRFLNFRLCFDITNSDFVFSENGNSAN